MNASTRDHPVIAFDGVCVLCHGFVHFMLTRDVAGRFRFASTESETGRGLFAVTGQDPSDPATVILAVGGRFYTKSDAALRSAAMLGGVWNGVAVLRLIPRPLRDWIYSWVASHRYRMFGKLETCPLPRTEWADRFLP